VSFFEIRRVAIDHADASYLITLVQQTYLARYGGFDDDPMDPEQFAPPRGGFYVGYLAGAPVASGAWRHLGHEALGSTHAAEVKRMFVIEEFRRRGLARRILTHLENEAAAAGCEVVTLSTGSKQPEAVDLYHRQGYADIAPFGYYADS
jgi:GNAT superfamily N-acetyltransferase